MIKLKPQWKPVQTADRAYLVSEVQRLDVATDVTLAFLNRLQAGVEVSDLSDQEFLQMQGLSDRGFISTTEHADAPGWELHPSLSSWDWMAQQFQHLTLDFTDLGTTVGTDVMGLLSGMGFPLRTGQDEHERLHLLFATTHRQLPQDFAVPTLPIICGLTRMRLWIGPIQFPEPLTPRLSALAEAQGQTDPSGYCVPPAFRTLQVPLIAVAIGQMLGATHQTQVTHMLEFNMLTLRSAYHEV